MDIPIGNGIISQINKPYYYTEIITKKGLFDFSMKLYKEFYEKYPDAIKWDYERFFRDILEYYE